MGRASSSKKVARAAAAGSKIKTPRQTGLLFPGALAAVLLVGSLLIAYGKTHQPNANTTAPLANAQDDPLGRGHWHAAYGIYDCDHFVAPITNQNDAYNGVSIGIHTHGDGVIHIHPFTTAASGRNARLGWFIKDTGITLTDSKIRVVNTSGTGSSATSTVVIDESNGKTCTIGGKKPSASLKIAVWVTRTAASPVIYTSGFKNIQFTSDQMLITIGFVPSGVTLPKPTSEPVLDALSDVGKTATAPTTTVPSGTATTTATTAPGGSSTTASATGTTSATVTTTPASTTSATTSAATTTSKR